MFQQFNGTNISDITYDYFKVEAVSHIVNIAYVNTGRCEVGDEQIYHWVCRNCKYTTVRHDNKKDTPPQFYPIVPKGEGLSEIIPEDIRKDFDEARLVTNYSIRCANVLLRTCIEKISDYVIKQFDPEKQKEYIKRTNLHRKLQFIETLPLFDGILHQMMTCIKDYGNDIHAHKKIEDSDTPKAFDDLQEFIQEICKEISLKIARRQKVKKMQNAKG